jgi:hypothetical protein
VAIWAENQKVTGESGTRTDPQLELVNLIFEVLVILLSLTLCLHCKLYLVKFLFLFWTPCLLCDLICCVRLSFREKHLPQPGNGHWWGFSLWWIDIICRLRCSGLLNGRPHPSKGHTESLCSTSEECDVLLAFALGLGTGFSSGVSGIVAKLDVVLLLVLTLIAGKLESEDRSEIF